MKKIITLFGLVLIHTMIRAQLPANAWAKSFEGASSMVSTGRAVAVDGSGNVYSTGSFQGTVDFDPGIGTFTLAAVANEDVFVTKLDAAGNFVWAKSIGGSGIDRGYGIVIDASGNVIVCGYFVGANVDFDPGAGTVLKNSGGSSDADAYALKLTAAGAYVAAYTLGGSSDDVAQGVATDATGNIYVTGFVHGLADLDPTAGVSNYTSVGGSDIFIIKMGPSNNFLWGKAFGGTGIEVGNAIALDGAGGVFITGYYEGTCDFDPTAATLNLTSAGYQDAYIAKYTSAGAVSWAKTIGSPTGNDVGTGLALDPPGSLYAVGNFAGTVDLDPSAGTNTVSSNSGTTDFYIVKLTPGGGPLWGKSIGGTMPDYAYGITVDSYSDAYVCGNYGSVVDFDPDAGVANVGVNGNTDFFVTKIISNGTYGWAKGMGGGLTEIAYGITVDASKNLYTTGNFNSLTDFDPNVLSYTLTTAGGTTDAFVHKMGLCPTVNAAITGTNVLCNGASTGAMQASSTGGVPYMYSWTPSIGSAAYQPNRPAGSYTVTVTNDCYNTGTDTYTITQPPLLSHGFPSSQTICSGQSATLTMVATGGTGGYTYTWNGPNLSSTTTASTIASPLSSTTYTYSVMDANACVKSNTLIVTVNPLPTVTAGASHSTLCVGSTSTLSATGTSTAYVWNTGATTSSTTVSPAATTVYSVTGTGSNGCNKVQTVTVTVNPLPVASALTSTPVCLGGNLSFTNTSTGASNYSWAGPSTFTSSVANPTITNLTSGNAGTYTLSATSAAGCTKTTTLAVTVNALPSLTITPASSTLCAGNTVAVTGSGAITYTWMPGASTGSAQTFTPASTTVYTLSGTNAAGCVGTRSLNVTVNALPSLTVSPASPTICAGGTTTLTASGAASYSWSSGPTTTSISVSPASTTAYTVTGTNANGCVSTKTATVPVNANPVVLATVNSPVCSGTSITFTNNSTGAGVYSWSGPFSYTSSATAPVIANATNAQSGIYTLTGINAATGCTASTTVAVTVSAPPAINISTTGNPACTGGTVSIGANGTALTYTWNPGSLTGAVQTFTVTSGTNFTVSGTDAAGCIGVNTASITVNPLKAVNGTVSASSNPVAGQVTLYKYQSFLTKFDSITTQNTNGTGAYSFTAVPAGSYIVKATPTTNTLQTTYGGSAISWQNATVISHYCINPSTQNINVLPFFSVGSGSGVLSGKITEGQGFGQRPSSPYSPLSPGQPIGGIVVKGGKNPGGNMFAQTTTAADGTYTLSGLPIGDYFILVDIPGLDTNGTYHPVISGSITQYTNLDFVVDSAKVNPVPNTTGIKTNSSDVEQIHIYPNPARNTVTVQYRLSAQASVHIELVDILGKTVKMISQSPNQPADKYRCQVDVSDLTNGLYFIKATINNSQTTTKLVIGD